MHKKQSSHYISTFRHASRTGKATTLEALGKFRQASDTRAYAKIISSFKIGASKIATFPAPSAYIDLHWHAPLPPIELAKELIWAKEWILQYTDKIIAAIEARKSAQNLVEQNNIDEALSVLTEFNHKHGWSLWATEAIFALTTFASGFSTTKALGVQLQKGAKHRLSGLFATILSDRNDPTLPFTDFRQRCLNSFYRYDTKWMTACLLSRSIRQIDHPLEDYPLILSATCTSSIYDYYEAVIDCLACILANSNLHPLIDHAFSFTSAIKNRISDPRITKIHTALEIVRDGSGIKNINIKHPHKREQPSEDNEFSRVIQKRLQACVEDGIVDSDDAQETYRIGVNLNSLPFGQRVASAATCTLSDLRSKNLGEIGLFLAEDDWSLDDLLVLPDKAIEGVLKSSQSLQEDAIACDVLEFLSGGTPVVPTPARLYLWAARRAEQCTSIGAALKLLDLLSAHGQSWRRQADKISIQILSDSNETTAALWKAAFWLVEDPLYAYELPLESIFSNKKWFHFKADPPELVGLVAHHANTVTPDSNSRFICRMACKSFCEKEAEKSLEGLWVEKTQQIDQHVFLAFLRDAWSEENLSLVTRFHSTQEIRRERIKIFQHMLSWDQKHSDSYSDLIKELTLDETLWNGLVQIDEKRIFVNEAAIARWAEKELYAPFERWKTLKSASSVERISNDMLRNYLVEPNIAELLKSLPEQATEADALLLNILDRLMQRFFRDPAEGLDSYLSLRVRHGSLRGTLLGPLEQEGLLISGSSSEEVFHRKWDDLVRQNYNPSLAVDILKKFTFGIQEIIKFLVSEKIQIYSQSKPNGEFVARFSPDGVKLILGLFDSPVTYSQFLSSSFAVFWSMLNPVRSNLADYICGEFKQAISDLFNDAISSLSAIDTASSPLIQTLRATNTATQGQCDLVANWFRPRRETERRTYLLEEAVEIARRATANVYRAFNVDIKLNSADSVKIPLSPSGLSTLYDCLYVVFENAWKHSDLPRGPERIDIQASFDEKSSLLTLVLVNEISSGVRAKIDSKFVLKLKETYLTSLPVALIPIEGGSGFAKLARIVSTVDPTVCSTPLDFGIDENNHWFVKVTIPLYQREGVYDAFQ